MSNRLAIASPSPVQIPHNGNGHKPQLTTNALNELKATLTQNLSLFRRDLMATMMDPRRDYDHECGYPPEITPQEYHNLYEREGIAARVVEVFPKECWSVQPEIYEGEEASDTEFENAWKELCESRHIYHYLQRADIMSGIGAFGIILLGLDDGIDMMVPVEGLDARVGTTTSKKNQPKRKLLFLRTFDESVTRVSAREQDVTNQRFSFPTTYVVQFREEGVHGMPIEIISRTIHWSRCIHVADNRLMSEIYGYPRMQKVFNRLLDVRKLCCGSAEMYWRGAFPGYSFEVNPDQKDSEIDPESIKREMEDYSNGLKRYLALTGVTAKSLAPQVTDPKGALEAQLTQIAIAIEVPKRILFGSEEAKLASVQDDDTWAKRVKARQENYVSPMLIRPFVDRLITIGVLPPPQETNSLGEYKYKIHWPDYQEANDDDVVSVALKATQAISQYVQSGASQLMQPMEYLTLVLKYSKEEAEQILQASGVSVSAQNPDMENQREEEGEGTTSEQAPPGGGQESIGSDAGMNKTTQQMQQEQDYKTMFGSATGNPGPGGWGGPGGGMGLQFNPMASRQKSTMKPVTPVKGGGYSQQGAGLPGLKSPSPTMHSGTSEGALKAWETRCRGLHQEAQKQQKGTTGFDEAHAKAAQAHWELKKQYEDSGSQETDFDKKWDLSQKAMKAGARAYNHSKQVSTKYYQSQIGKPVGNSLRAILNSVKKQPTKTAQPIQKKLTPEEIKQKKEIELQRKCQQADEASQRAKMKSEATAGRDGQGDYQHIAAEVAHREARDANKGIPGRERLAAYHDKWTKLHSKELKGRGYTQNSEGWLKVRNEGTSEGAKKGWETRQHGGHDISVDPTQLKHAQTVGQLFGSENVELYRNGDDYGVNKRIGVQSSVPLARGFKSHEESREWIKQQKHLTLSKTVSQEDPNAEELKDRD